MNRTTHPIEREDLMAWLDGELSPERAASVAAHVKVCDECLALAEELRRVSAQMAAWKVEPAPASLDARVSDALQQTPQREVLSSLPSKRRFLIPTWAWQLGAVAALLLIIVAISIPNLLRSRMAANEATRESLERSRLAQQIMTDAEKQQAAVGRGEAGIPQPSGPMIIRSATLVVVSKEFDAARGAFERLLRQHGGYIAQLSISGQGGTARALTATLRVPADRMDALFAELKKIGRVEGEGQMGEEVTQQYVDLVARQKNARVTEQRLAQILTQRTGKVSDVLEVEREIARVRGEIEQMEAQRKTLENQVAFASVKFELREEYQAQLNITPPSTSTRLRNAAVEGYKSATENAIDLAVFFLNAGPTLLLWGLIFFWPARLLWRRFRRATA
ncbi:MAG: DUF4349 domain-containing protein [Acidobacteria bacterium]|nr:DUF4349 domain-containing protein [Acidobacteriota bacterium]